MKIFLESLKSNKGFTMQDVIIAIVIFGMFAGLISSTFLLIFKLQSETLMTAAATLYAIQILENTDKILYSEVVNGMEESYRQLYNISEKFNLSIIVDDPIEDKTMKKITLTISYEFGGHQENLVFEKYKVNEFSTQIPGVVI